MGAGSFMERTRHLWFWDDDGSFVQIELMGSGPHVRRVRHGHVVTASWGEQTGVQVLTWRDGRAVRCDEARRSSSRGSAVALVAEHAADGSLLEVRRQAEQATGDLRADLELAAAMRPAKRYWDGRIERPERWPEDDGALVEPLAVALDAALREAVAAAPVHEPFVLEVLPQGNYPAFPPVARVAGVQWREGIRRSSEHDGAATSNLSDAVKSGAGAGIDDLADRLDDEALRSCRIFSTALRPGTSLTPDLRAGAVADAVGQRLTELLHAAPLDGAADPFLALVHVGDRLDRPDARARARAAAGEAHYARFMASVRSTKAGGEVDPAAVERAATDRAALEALLRDGGLGDHAHRLAHEVAELGLLLVPGAARSRLGGPALLPRGEAWPDGHTFLAAIDLSELPATGLPERGWLLFFAALGPDENEDYFYGEEPNAPGARARVFATDDPVEVEQQGDALEHRPVVARPFLTLPERLGRARGGRPRRLRRQDVRGAGGPPHRGPARQPTPATGWVATPPAPRAASPTTARSCCSTSRTTRRSGSSSSTPARSSSGSRATRSPRATGRVSSRWPTRVRRAVRAASGRPR